MKNKRGSEVAQDGVHTSKARTGDGGEEEQGEVNKGKYGKAKGNTTTTTTYDI
jgi:hypothetical protein